MKNARHVGVYGIVVQDEKILVIKKGRGPYTGLWDLPGGSFEHGETPEMALEREFLEEIGVPYETAALFCVESNLATWNDNDVITSTHHIGIYFSATLHSRFTIKTDADGHDSLGASWIDIKRTPVEAFSPIVQKVLLKLSTAAPL